MRRLLGLRTLGLFWAGLLVVAGAGTATLQLMGPPAPAAVVLKPSPSPPQRAAWEHPAAAPPHADHAPAGADTVVVPSDRTVIAAPPPTRIAAPDPALMEPSVYFWPAQLPRVATDGRAPRTEYAAAAPATAGKPRVAVLMSGFGLSDKDSRAALEVLPTAVSFAVSAHAGNPLALLDAARAGGHELLASIPMEPPGWPLNDEGEKSLRTGLSPEQNRMNLEWSLSRTQGAVGATAASDGMRGERFAEVSGALTPVLEAVARRGLLYIDPRPGRRAAVPGLVARSVDVVIDDLLARTEIEARLGTLLAEAKDHGQALALAGPLRPATIELIAAWAKTLDANGVVLVPVSALVGE